MNECVEEEEEEASREVEEEGEGFQEEMESVQGEITGKMVEIIKKVRKLARMFRKSPTKNDCLQKYCTEAHGVELQILSDVRTRWNTSTVPIHPI